MKKLILLAAAFILVCCNSSSDVNDSEDTPVVPEESVFVKGADLGWITEMEDKGYKFYNASGAEMECTELFASMGFNAVRCRVWVDPADEYCSMKDVLEKALRAKKCGMKVMIDFHYSDTWADPGKQTVPSAWKGLGVQQMADAVFSHTKEVLTLLKDNAIEVSWIQIGNEVTNGMLWESGRVKGQDAANFASYFNAGYRAARQVYPDAKVILHIDNAWKLETLKWFYTLANAAGCHYDIIGLSLYPSYWEGNAYPDWKPKCTQALNNFKTLYELYKLPVMLVEFGMPASQPQESRDALQFLLDGVKGYDWFKGIVLWEPESEQSRNNYSYGAFNNGKATIALDPFKL